MSVNSCNLPGNNTGDELQRTRDYPPSASTNVCRADEESPSLLHTNVVPFTQPPPPAPPSFSSLKIRSSMQTLSDRFPLGAFKVAGKETTLCLCEAGGT